ncbi:hypothetical protein IAU59_000734 [Kwoniella sp. CBS 9459]
MDFFRAHHPETTVRGPRIVIVHLRPTHPSYVNTLPRPQTGMSEPLANDTASLFTPPSPSSSSKWVGKMKGLSATPSEQKLATPSRGVAYSGGSAGSSVTAVDAGHKETSGRANM